MPSVSKLINSGVTVPSKKPIAICTRDSHTRIHQCSETSAVKPTLTCHWAGICICFPVLFQAAGTNMWFCIFLGRWWLRTGANSFDSSFFLRNVVSMVSIFLCCLWPVACGPWPVNVKSEREVLGIIGGVTFDLNGSLSTFVCCNWIMVCLFMMVCRAGRPIIRPQMLPYFACCIANKASHLEPADLVNFFVMHCQDQNADLLICFRHVRIILQISKSSLLIHAKPVLAQLILPILTFVWCRRLGHGWLVMRRHGYLVIQCGTSIWHPAHNPLPQLGHQ